MATPTYTTVNLDLPCEKKFLQVHAERFWRAGILMGTVDDEMINAFLYLSGLGERRLI